MSYEIEVHNVPSQPIAVVRGRTSFANIGATIRRLYGKVYPVPAYAGKPGLNIVYYPNDSSTKQDFPLEAGMQVDAMFQGQDDLVCSATPLGSGVAALNSDSRAVRCWPRVARCLVMCSIVSAIDPFASVIMAMWA